MSNIHDYIYHGTKLTEDTEARASFRYRLREAARQALTLGDALLQMSQDATEPDQIQLGHLRDMESSLDVILNIRMGRMKDSRP